MNEERVKQIIVVRRDLEMRRGKEMAQGAHASMMWLTLRLRDCGFHAKMGEHSFKHMEGLDLSPAEFAWVRGLFTKIVVQVPALADMEALVERARAAGHQAHIVLDSGLTEFKGVATKTCAAIGPSFSNEIDLITRGLELY